MVPIARPGPRVTTLQLETGRFAGSFVRLVSYLPGDLCAKEPQPPALLQAIGSFLGRVDRALLDFSHPSADRPDFKWNLDRGPWYVRHNVSAIHDAERRALVEGHLAYFDASVAPLLPRCRESVIHSDANDYNILVRGDDVAGADTRVRTLTHTHTYTHARNPTHIPQA